MPTIAIEVFKDETLIESIFLENKPFFIFGRHPKNDVVLLHESLSRQHAAFVLDRDQGALLIDLMSKAGTKVDGKEAQGCIPVQLKQGGQKVQFGSSTRTYVVKVDYSRMEAAFAKHHRSLEQELDVLQRLDNKDDLDINTLKKTLGLQAKDTLFVSNFPYHFEQADLENLFKDCGKVVSIRMPEDRMTH